MRLHSTQLIILLLLGATLASVSAPRGRALRSGSPVSPTSDITVDTLSADDGDPQFIFRYPDVYGDDLRNMWFQMPYDAAITGVLFGFATDNSERWTTGDPDLITLIWASGEDSLPIPDEILLRDTLLFEEFSAQVYDLGDEWTDSTQQFVYVDLHGYNLSLSLLDGFNAGYTALLNSPDDSLAILADDGSPETDRASEWYNDAFHRMNEAWRGVNLMIRVLIETADGVAGMLNPAALPGQLYLEMVCPNPFNASAQVTFYLGEASPLTFEVFDIIGRRLQSGRLNTLGPGRHTVSIDGSAWSSGVYFLRLSTVKDIARTKLILQK